MYTKSVSETLVYLNYLTRLSAQEDFTEPSIIYWLVVELYVLWPLAWKSSNTANRRRNEMIKVSGIWSSLRYIVHNKCVMQNVPWREKSQTVKSEKFARLAKRSKNDATKRLNTIYGTPVCGRYTEVNDDCTFILQPIILASYLTCHDLSNHKWTAYAPSHNLQYPLLYSLSSVTVFSVNRCTPNHRWRFSVFRTVHRFTSHSFIIQSCIMFYLSWFLYRCSTHGFRYQKLTTLSPVMVCGIHNCILPCQ